MNTTDTPQVATPALVRELKTLLDSYQYRYGSEVQLHGLRENNQGALAPQSVSENGTALPNKNYATNGEQA